MANHPYVGLGNTQETGNARPGLLVIESHDDDRALSLVRSGCRCSTAAVLVEAKRAGLLARVRPTLDALLAKGFRLDRKVYDRILKAADEE